MKPPILASLLVAAILGSQPPRLARAEADDSSENAARCEKGLAHAASKDLPRAALYLEHCRTEALEPALADQVTRTRADVAHKLDASKLSALSIVTTPEGLVAQTDAMPGERFTTPATIWTKAGTYRVDVARDAAALDAGQGMSTTATLDAFSRRTVILNLPTKQTAPRAGKVDFTEETPEQTAHEGPPAKVEFKPILPDKYFRRRPPSGPELDDPFAYRDDGSLRWRLGARVGGGVFDHAATRPGAALSVAVLAGRPIAGPVALAARLGYTHRDVDAFALDAGTRLRLLHAPSLRLTATVALRAEVRIQDTLAMQPVTRVGLGASAGVELALRTLPVTIGLRAEPSFTELVPGTRSHSLLLELGYDW